MKYELFFLNNIHDSMEMVNAELDPFLDLSSISTFEQIIEDVANAMKEIAEFVEKEVIEDLPKETQKDFQSSIADYRKYAAILKEFKL